MKNSWLTITLMFVLGMALCLGGCRQGGNKQGGEPAASPRASASALPSAAPSAAVPPAQLDRQDLGTMEAPQPPEHPRTDDPEDCKIYPLSVGGEGFIRIGKELFMFQGLPCHFRALDIDGREQGTQDGYWCYSSTRGSKASCATKPGEFGVFYPQVDGRGVISFVKDNPEGSGADGELSVKELARVKANVAMLIMRVRASEFLPVKSQSAEQEAQPNGFMDFGNNRIVKIRDGQAQLCLQMAAGVQGRSYACPPEMGEWKILNQRRSNIKKYQFVRSPEDAGVWLKMEGLQPRMSARIQFIYTDSYSGQKLIKEASLTCLE